MISCSKFHDMVSVCLLISCVCVFLVTRILESVMSRKFHKVHKCCCIYDLRRQNWKLLYSLRNYKIETSSFHMFFLYNNKFETFYKLKKTVQNYSRAWKIACALVSVYLPCKKSMHRNFEIPSISKIFERYFTEIFY